MNGRNSHYWQDLKWVGSHVEVENPPMEGESPSREKAIYCSHGARKASHGCLSGFHSARFSFFVAVLVLFRPWRFY